MNKTYHYEIPASQYDGMVSCEFNTIEECVEDCKRACAILNVDYNRRDVMLFMSDDFGETWEECTEEGELAG